MTMQKLSHVRVKRKGQVTIPKELRSKLGIEEGALLEIKEEEGTITLKPTPKLKAGKAVGDQEYKKSSVNSTKAGETGVDKHC
jgi:AbrB family looped-hinge helix DNA binding protein